jgi:hypothetical protein
MNDAIFKEVRCVAVPVTDQDRSKRLFEQLGFAVSWTRSCSLGSGGSR